MNDLEYKGPSIQRQYSVREEYRELIEEMFEMGHDKNSIKDYFSKMFESGALKKEDYKLIQNLISSRFSYSKKREEVDELEEQEKEKEQAKKLYNLEEL